MRRVPGLVSSFAAATLAVTLLAVAGPASAARRDPLEVTPSTLPVGATPTVAWYRSAKHEIVRPGQRPVTIPLRTSGRPEGPGVLLNARHGWIRTDARDRTSFVDTSGKTRWRGARPDFRFSPTAQMVAVDGRTFVDLGQRLTKAGRFSATTVRVRRTRDGKVLRSRTFPRSLVQVRAATSSVVALTVVHHRAGHAVFATEYWNQRTGRLRVFRRHREPGSLPSGFYRAPAASLAHHLIVAAHESAIRNSRTGRVLWRTSGDRTISFSPHGTHVVTLDDNDFGYEDGFVPRTMRIRNARTGAILATFHGNFTYETDSDSTQGPTWESESRLVILAYDAATTDEEGYLVPSGPAWIRCTTAGTCTRVPINGATDYVTIPRSD